MSNNQAKVDTLIVSDIHLGSPVTRGKECQDLINSFWDDQGGYKMKRLILLGDVFDTLNFDKFKPWEWGFVNLLRNISEADNGVEVVWMIGNHDIALDDLMFNMFGKKVYESYEWQVGNLKCFAMHGHQFDKWIRDYPVLTAIPYWIYSEMQKIDGRHHYLSRFFKELTKKLLKVNDELSSGMIKYLANHNLRADAVFCGHTHLPDIKCFEPEKICYYNSGCWTGMHAPNYITIDASGKVELHEYNKPLS